VDLSPLRTRPCGLTRELAAVCKSASTSSNKFEAQARPDFLETVSDIEIHCSLPRSEESCAVFGMPRKAIELGIVDRVLSKAEIAEVLAGIECSR
jgi:hypothetical protein